MRTRDLLVLTLGGDEAEHVLSDDAEAEDMSDLHRQADALGLQQLTAMAEIMDDTLGHMAGAASPRMRLELLAAKLLAGRASGFAAEAPALAGAGARGSSAAPSATQGSARGGFVDAQRPSGFNDGATAPQSGHDTPPRPPLPLPHRKPSRPPPRSMMPVRSRRQPRTSLDPGGHSAQRHRG